MIPNIDIVDQLAEEVRNVFLITQRQTSPSHINNPCHWLFWISMLNSRGVVHLAVHFFSVGNIGDGIADASAIPA